MNTDPGVEAESNAEPPWHRVGKLDEIEPGAGREYLVDGKVLAVFRTTDGLAATDGMCAHQGGPLAQGFLDGGCITCPWHGWQYHVQDGCNMLTGKKMLDTYAVEERDGDVWVRV